MLAQETLAIDVCCNLETSILGSSSVIRLPSLSSPSVTFYLRLSGDPEVTFNFSGVGMAPSEKDEAAWCSLTGSQSTAPA